MCYYFPEDEDDRDTPDDFVDPVLEEDKKFLGEGLFIIEATEPSNIIWENRFTTFHT